MVLGGVLPGVAVAGPVAPSAAVIGPVAAPAAVVGPAAGAAAVVGPAAGSAAVVGPAAGNLYVLSLWTASTKRRSCTWSLVIIADWPAKYGNTGYWNFEIISVNNSD